MILAGPWPPVCPVHATAADAEATAEQLDVRLAQCDACCDGVSLCNPELFHLIVSLLVQHQQALDERVLEQVVLELLVLARHTREPHMLCARRTVLLILSRFRRFFGAAVDGSARIQTLLLELVCRLGACHITSSEVKQFLQVGAFQAQKNGGKTVRYFTKFSLQKSPSFSFFWVFFVSSHHLLGFSLCVHPSTKTPSNIMYIYTYIYIYIIYNLLPGPCYF